jgi:hypothetical protein
MDAIKQYTSRIPVVAVAALILGIVLGVLYAWVISPVEWVNGTPADMRDDLRVDYLRMVIDSYEVNQDPELALARFDELGEFKDETLDMVGSEPGEVSPSALQKFQALAAVESDVEPAAGDESGAAAEGETGIQPATEPAGGEEAPSGSPAARLILPVCGGTILLGALLGLALFLRRRLETREEVEEPEEYEFGEEAAHTPMPFESPATEYEMPEEQPLATFRTTYALGDDLYDDSFSIESPATGDFLGECGVGIAEVMSVGEPKKVSGFEIWLFDKNDIQTVTKIVLSSYAFNDEDTRGRLSAKGDPFQAESGGVVELETASLRVEARIVDLSYGEGALPNESFFDRMTIELKAIAKG